MSKEKIQAFVDYVETLKGDEKGEAQNYCERLFQAFEHKGLSESGIELEKRVKGKKNTKYADLVWDKRVLIEMKKRGEKLESHKAQVLDIGGTYSLIALNIQSYAILMNLLSMILQFKKHRLIKSKLKI